MRVRPAIAASLVSFAMAQEPSPAVVAGRVLGLDRKGVAEATVELLHREIAFSHECGREERVRVVSNRTGVFRAAVSPGRRYTLRAFWADGASRVEEGVEAGGFVTLVADPQAHARRVEVEGLQPFAERGPFTLRVVVGGETIDFVDVPIADGVAALPPMPAFDQRPLEVLDARGSALWCDQPVAASTHEVDGAMKLIVPAPYLVELRVCDDKDSAPLAGARIQFHVRNHWITNSPRYAFGERFRAVWPELGVTDHEGRLRVHVPLPDTARAAELPTKLWLLAHRDGYRSNASGWESGKPFRTGKLLETVPAELEIRLEAEAPARTKLVDAEGAEPLVATKALLGWRLWVRGEGVGTGMPYFALADVVDGVLVHPPPALGARLESMVLNDVRQRRVSWQSGAPDGDLALHSPGEELLPIEVLLPDGRPGARVLVFAEYAGPTRTEHDPRVARTDRLGRALVSIRGSTRVFVSDGAAYGTLLVDPSRREALRIEMKSRPLARVRVLDFEDAPVAGVVVSATNTGMLAAADSELSEAQRRLLQRWTEIVLTDDEGRARIPWGPTPTVLSVRLRDPRRPLLDAGAEQIEDPGETERTLRWTLPRD
ncbi:MAG: hypothetical protein IT457_22130 [Planctomycetes bacterium]|nr:hypothetical protein [Planctomycetota bacterium]